MIEIKLRAWVYTRRQLSDVLDDGRFEYVYVPMKLIDDALIKYSSRIIILPPEYLADCEEKVISRLSALKETGFKMALAHTVGHIEILQNLGYEIFGGSRLNVTNSETIKFFREQGVRDLMLSSELTAEQMNKLCDNAENCETGFIAYGNLPLMLNRRCPIKNGKPCGKECCGRQITDRTGRKLDVICSENTVEILNSDTLVLSDRLGSFNADYAVLRFTVENDVKPVIDAYSAGRGLTFKNITRGLYFRGVE